MLTAPEVAFYGLDKDRSPKGLIGKRRYLASGEHFENGLRTHHSVLVWLHNVQSFSNMPVVYGSLYPVLPAEWD